MVRAVDLTGQKFGRLTVVRLSGRKASNRFWHCVCECGNRTETDGGKLKNGETKSCGCFRREFTTERNKRWAKHGQTVNGKFTPEYESWRAMHHRCRDKNHRDYPYWGGRGITVCERWSDFNNFLADMGSRPPGTSLDRYPNNNGNYEPGNCRWATASQQRQNQRTKQQTKESAI